MKSKLMTVFCMLIIASILMTACAPKVEAPAAEVPAAEEPVAEAPAAEQEPAAVEEPAPAEKVVVTWWHITTKEPGLSIWQKMADDYMAEHPNVVIEITVLENEAFKSKLTTVMQSGEAPDIFQSWGGGTLNEQIEAGLVQDITPYLDADGGAWRDTFAPGALAVYGADGKNYGVPWDMGMVGWWYNKELFAQAGIDSPPTTWAEFLEDVQKLKDAGITPIALGEGDSWTGMHIWSYLATRIGGEPAFTAAATRTGSFADPAFVQAGEELKKLIDMEPFQDGYLGATHDEMQATFGNGKAAMELSGQWAPSVQAANSADQLGVHGDNLGLFNFPAVEGGVGDVTDVIGGGNGFAIGKDAEPEAIDFIKYVTNQANQTIIAAEGQGIPVVKGSEAGLTDPNMALVQQSFANAKFFQLYYDQLLPPALGGAINDAVQKLYAGIATPEEVAQEIEAVAAQEIK